MIPLSLYIHLPWCIKKCPYCDFNAHPLKSQDQFDPYIHRVIEDLSQYEEIIYSRGLQTIFIGGGTPSLFSPEQLYPLFEKIKSLTTISNIEVTIEANPGTRDTGYFKGYRELGINRISIGGQSFDPTLLEKIGRIHDGEGTAEAIEIAQTAGFDRINLDIMYGLPSQTLEQALNDLSLFLKYKLEHLSWYQLNIEANTLFAAKTPPLPNSHLIDEMDEYGSNLLTENGYKQYEISAWTNHTPSMHNLNYWMFGDYIGIGCGAHSKITTQSPFKITRTIKNKHPKAYLGQDLIQHSEEIKQQEIILEYIIGHMRTQEPLYFKTFEKRTNLPYTMLLSALESSISQGLIEQHATYVQTSEKGFRHHNDICLNI